MIAKDPLISVILPCYNHGKFLKSAIKSVFSNCSRSLELIIINDGSTDNTLSELDQFKNDPRVTIINQQNIGLAESLNKGFSLAKGNYLTWTSADNLYKNHALDKLSNFLDCNPNIDFVYSDVQLIDDDSNSLINSSYRIANQDPQNSSILRLPREPETLALYADNFINACFMYRSWIPKELGGYKKELLGYEDYEYWLRILVTGQISHIGIDDVLYKYRIHQQSLTGQLNSDKLCQEQRKIVAQYAKLINPNPKNTASVSRNENDLITNFLDSLPLEYSAVSIDAPKILSRIKSANYRAYKLSKGTKKAVTLLLPDFIKDNDLEFYYDLIKFNPKLTFVCLNSNSKQSELGALLKTKCSGKVKNLVTIDLTQSSGPKDDLLPEEAFLPFVYALSGTSAIICETGEIDKVSQALICLSAGVRTQCILLAENHLTGGFPPFCTFIDKDKIIKSKITIKDLVFNDSVFSRCLESFCFSKTQEKQHKLINLRKLSNFNVSNSSE